MLRRIQLLTAALGFLLFNVLPIHAQTAQKTNPDDAAIRQIVQQLEDGWNAHDGKAFAAPFAADADYVVIDGMKVKGKEAIQRGHIGIFTTVYKDSHNAAMVKGVRFLRQDVALVHVEWTLEVHTGVKAGKGTAMCSMVMTKESGKWAIAAFHNTPIRTEER